MMYTLSRLLLAATLVASNTASNIGIRGTAKQLRNQEGDLDEKQERNQHRYLMPESECTLFVKSAMYLPTDDHRNGHEKDSWVCKLTKEDSKRLNVKYVEIDEASIVPAIANATSGKSVLSMSQAIVDVETDTAPKLFLPKNSHVEVKNVRDQTRNTQRVTGTLQTLVVRLTNENNVAPDLSVQKLYNDVFDDGVCLKSQLEACSYGKVKIEPFRGRTPSNLQVDKGIVDVKMDGKGDYETQAFNAAEKLIGDLEDPMFDLIMFCYPEGVINNYWGYAYSHKYSFYNNDKMQYVSLQMHEVGHNLNLAHSGERNNEYGDTTGFMGTGLTRDDERMCYNAQKNYQLGWYEDQTTTIDPLAGNGSHEIILNGISDYKKNNDAYVAVRLEQTSNSEDYYLGFNHAAGITADIREDRNEVSILRKRGDLYQRGKSWKIRTLKQGQSYVIQNFNGETDVTVEFVRLENGDATIRVTSSDPDGDGDDENDDFQTPTPPPTPKPTKKCRNEAKMKRFKLKRITPRRTCKSWSKRGKCESQILVGENKGRFLWELCKKSCNRCGELQQQ